LLPLLFLLLAPTARAATPLRVLVQGQSNAGNYAATFAVDDAAARVTTPAPNGLFSTAYRVLYAEGAMLNGATNVLLNDFPCADAQCTGTQCSGENRTAAGHPDLDPNDGDGTCSCDCGAAQGTSATEAASAWPALAAWWMAERGGPVRMITAALGGSCLVRDDGSHAGEPLWSPRERVAGVWADVDCATRDNGSVLDQRGDLLCASHRAAGDAGGAPHVVVFLQGECERDGFAVYGELSGAAAYAAALRDLVDRNWEALGVPTVIAPISSRATPGPTYSGSEGQTPYEPGTPAFQVRAAQLDVIATHPHACRGPSLDDLEHEADGVHVRAVDVLGRRWAAAIEACLAGAAYDGGARVPRCGDETLDAALGELCDDGNAVASDGCDAICRRGACDDGLDNDADGFADFPSDPGCREVASTETPACQNGLDDDGQPGVDFDGGASARGGVAVAEPDPQCATPWARAERRSCGIGAELAIGSLLASGARRARHSARRLPS
jgi:cysteine-rich repeat protein